MMRARTIVLLAAAFVLLARTPRTTAQDLDALFNGGAILSRPTDHGITVRAIAGRALTATMEWRVDGSNDEWRRSAPANAAAGAAVDLVADGLAPDTAYTYRLSVVPQGASGPATVGSEGRFRTQRRRGSPFSFVVQADPHLDENSSTAVYTQALRNQLADRPDFLIDLGDAAMTDRCVIAGDNLCGRDRATSYEQVAARNTLMRSYFAQVAHSLPLFLVLGNHEAESGWATTGSAATLAEWSLRARTASYANPVPDGFYSGNATVESSGIARQNYYAFEWGDALFVVLDPFAYTMKKPTQFTDADMWNWTFGEAQYRWLVSTLTSSRARYKFVFSHHMVGGGTAEVRGGAAFADLFEWGGRNRDGSWGFDTYRPGWPTPIQQLLRDTGVNIWFHGHDHLYAREEVDGVVYQSVPQPSTSRYQGPDLAREYGYRATPGDTAFVTPGHLRVSIDTQGIRVDFIRAVAPGEDTPTLRNGAIVTSYSVR